jgi:hypothetical protein
MSQNLFRQNIVTGGKRGMSQKRGRDMGIIQRVPLSPSWTLAAKEFFSQKRDCQYQKVSDGKIIFKCNGQYRFILYKWCNQYHIKCDHCLKEVVDKEQLTLFMGPISHIHASILHRITPCMEIDLEDKQAILSKHDDEFDAAYQTLFKSREIKKQPMNAIPTQYKGINFRSRLEAKWAKMFDLLGWRWEYEPFDLNGYIPDFMIFQGQKQILVEIKPDASFVELANSTQKARFATVGRSLVCFGSSIILATEENGHPSEDFPQALRWARLQDCDCDYREMVMQFLRGHETGPDIDILDLDQFSDDPSRFNYLVGTAQETNICKCSSCKKYFLQSIGYSCQCDDINADYTFDLKDLQDKWNQATNLTQYSRIFTTGS